jgi:predicted RNase H-like nuclease (RuvC/YqgF family)
VLEIMDAKLALEQGAVALSTTQADNYRRELEICCNDLSTCLDINAKKTKQVEELQSKVEQLSARCAEQQQELELLKAIPVPEKGQIDELQLERAVHLQIISDLRAQLQQEETAGVQQSKKDIAFEDANQGDDNFTQMSHDQPTSTELELPMTSHKVIAGVAEKELCLLDN